MMIVSLSWFEAAEAARLGVQRQIINLRDGRKDRHGFNGDGWGVNVEGCMCEMAYAKATGRYWEPVVRNFEDIPGDVGDVEIRSTKRTDGRLIVHEWDPDGSLFVLVRGPWPERAGVRFEIVGTKLGGEAKQQRWWAEPVQGRPAFFVPADELEPIAVLDRVGA
jgi:hypothetical protein